MEEKLINKSIFKKDKNELVMYSATWCNPCKKIKPDVLSFLEKEGFVLVDSSMITKEEYKKNYKFIPGFEVNKKYIQTSDIDNFKLFFNEHLNDFSHNSFEKI